MPHWQWAKADTNAKININPSYAKQINAASQGKVLWGVLKKRNMTYGQSALGDYKISVYDSMGNVLNSTTITGNVTLLNAQADDAGNWYILGQYYDTVNFAGGMQLIRNPIAFPATSEYFVFRLNSSSLSVAWVRSTSSDNDAYVNTFTVAHNGLYMPVDSGASATIIRKFDLASGNATDILTQTGQSISSSIAVDGIGNIYLAGSCAFTALNFNGHVGTSLSAYPAYIVRYKASGAYDWSYFMHDVTCVPRKISIASNNVIYYTGPIHDTLSLAGVPFHRGAWLYDLMIVKMDSTGTIGWTKQLKDTISGDADVEFYDHAAVGADGSLNIVAETRRYIDWGNGVITDIPGYGSTVSVINFSSSGMANWALPVTADYTSAMHIAVSGNGIWVTGNGYDSTALQFDTVSVAIPHGSYIPYLAKIHTNGTTGVSTVNTTTNRITIAPNPAHNEVSLYGLDAGKETTVTMTDIRGSIIFEKTFSNSQYQNINVANYARGLYFIEVRTGGYREMKKIILE